MANKYRIDRANSKRVPCGMASLCYLGDDGAKARSVYDATQPGIDAWGQPNCLYGVILSVWCEVKNDYVVKCVKGLGI